MCDHLVEKLGIVPGETDANGEFSLQKVECLGSCTTAPVLQVNDTYYERVTRSRLDGLIEALRAGEAPEPWRERHGDNAGLGGAEAVSGVAATATPDAAPEAGTGADAGTDAPRDEEGGA